MDKPIQNFQRKTKFRVFTLLAWIHIILFLFLILPGRYSFLQYAQMYNWDYIQLHLSRISFQEILGRQIVATLFILVFFAVCASLGLAILHMAKSLESRKYTSITDLSVIILTAFLIGQFAVAVFLFNLGLHTKLNQTNTILVLTATGFIGIAFSKHLRKSFSGVTIPSFSSSFSGKEKVFIVFFFLIIFLATFLSTSRLSYDAVAVYFSDAKLTALTNKIDFFLYRKFLVSNIQTGIIFSALMQVFNDQTARMLSWLHGCIIIIFSVALSSQMGLSKKAKIIQVSLLLSTTAFIDLLGDGKVDLQSMSFAIATVYWLVVSWQKKKTSLFFLTGLLTGIAMIARPFNIPLLGAFIGLYSLYQFFNHFVVIKLPTSQIFKTMLWLGIGTIPGVTLYLLANLFLLGDPLAPLHAAQNVDAQEWQWAFDKQYIWIVKLLYPFVVTYINSPQSLGNISPLVLGFLPVFFTNGIKICFKKSTHLVMLALTAAVVLALWVTFLFTVFEIRYIFFLWIILYMPVSVVIANLENTKFRYLSKFTDVVVIVLLAYSTLRIIKISIETYSPVNEKGYAECFDIAFCELESEINKIAIPGNRVLTLNAYRYYLDPELLPCTTRDSEYKLLYELSENSTGFWEEVYQQGYKYIAYEHNYSTRHLRINMVPDPNDTPPWIGLHPIYLSETGDEAVLEIQAVNPDINIKKICQKNASGIWEIQEISK